MGFLVLSFSNCKKNDYQDQIAKSSKDTSYRYFSSDAQPVLNLAKDTNFLIDGIQHHLNIEVKTHNDFIVSYNQIFTEGDSIIKEIYKGFDCSYIFTLYDDSNHLIFKKVFHKSDFVDIISLDALAQTNAILPNFKGYYNKFDALIFDINFWIPNSDVGVDCFVMINSKGDILEKSMSNYHGGCGCSDEPTLSEDSSSFLTCYKYIKASPFKSISLEKPNQNIVSARFLSNKYTLIIYEYDSLKLKENATIIDTEGNLIHSFEYHGYYCTLDHWVPMTNLSQNQTFYLLDHIDEEYRLLVLPKTNPTKTNTIPIDQLQKDTSQINKVFFELSTIVKSYKFNLDTTTNKISIAF